MKIRSENFKSVSLIRMILMFSLLLCFSCAKSTPPPKQALITPEEIEYFKPELNSREDAVTLLNRLLIKNSRDPFWFRLIFQKREKFSGYAYFDCSIEGISDQGFDISTLQITGLEKWTDFNYLVPYTYPALQTYQGAWVISFNPHISQPKKIKTAVVGFHRKDMTIAVYHCLYYLATGKTL